MSLGKNNNEIWNYIRGENEAGRMSSNTAYALIDKYGLSDPNSYKIWKKGNTLYAEKNGHYSTLNLIGEVTPEKIVYWGNMIGVDVSDYI